MRLTLIILITLFLSPFANANTNLEKRVADLEAKVTQLNNTTLSNCQMNYKYYTTVSNICPKNTVVRSVQLVSSNGPIQVACYYYQLQCKRNGVFTNIDIKEIVEE